MYLQSEEGIDNLLCLVSLNDTNWYGWATTGDWPGWTDRSRNLAAVTSIGSVCGKSQVWIAFKFESDESVTEEGAYIDEVKLTDETPPSVTAITPASGNVGSTVTLTGVGLAGVTAVSFNGAAAQFSVTSASQISATVPAGATSGPVTVTSPVRGGHERRELHGHGAAEDQRLHSCQGPGGRVRGRARYGP